MLVRGAHLRVDGGWLFAAAIWLVGGASAVVAPEALGQDWFRIVRVEEDWELVVADPDPSVDAPQVTCTFSPVDGVDGIYAAIELNHRSQPSFSAGGIQLQVWNGESLLAAKSFSSNAEFATENEQIRWTQTMTLSGSNLIFEVVNGSSTTWGAFGGQGYLKANINTTLTSLNRYHPNASVQNSGVGYAGNRVTSLTLREVRLITAAGYVLRDTTPRVAH